jgi:hypothetical protein
LAIKAYVTTQWRGPIVNQAGSAQSNIKVSFKNQTHYNVAFFLNGGTGLNTTLAAGKVQQYDMVVDPGVQPIIGIYQLSGPRLDFTVENNGKYVFIVKDDKIVNTYAPRAIIKVRFKNKTSSDVYFFLNGGMGLETKLAPGRVQVYTMVVDLGVQPIVGIYQPDGQRLDFKVFDNVRYAFIIQNGKIISSNNWLLHTR